MPNVAFILLIPLLPLAGFLLLGLFGRKYFKKSSGIIATALLLLSFIFSVHTAYGYFFDFGKINNVYEKIIPLKYTWLEFANGLSIDMGVLLDPIASMMLVIISFVSLMVHIYSLAYMKGEERFSTYYAFLCLFTFSMLGLVMSSNIFQMYFFWELVGVSSFLLIGYYYDKPSAVAACKKAFIVTRFADVGFLIGILVLSFYSGTLDFSTLIQKLTSPGSPELNDALGASFLGMSALTWGMILVFIGGAGKSAMFPLHIWLPDAMEGPYSCFSIDTCSNDGCCRCVFSSKIISRFCIISTGCIKCGCLYWRHFSIVRRGYCMYTNRYKTSARLFNHVANWLYDVCFGCFGLWWRRRIGLYCIDVSFVYTCHV